MQTIQSPEISPQQKHLEALISRYTNRTKTSKQFASNYRPVLADNRVATGFHLLVKEMLYPIVARRSMGSKIWDVDGNEYIDLMMGFGANLFGHNPPFIKEALQEQLEKAYKLGRNQNLLAKLPS